MIDQDRSNQQPVRQVYWTGKTQNATKASRTATDLTLLVGHVVQRDVYDHDGRPVSAPTTPTIPNVIQPVTATLAQDWGIVTELNPFANGQSVNDIPDSAAATQRRGGPVQAMFKGICYAYVANGVAVNDVLGPSNASSVLAVISLQDDPNGDTAEFRTKYAKALEANSSGAAALRLVEIS